MTDLTGRIIVERLLNFLSKKKNKFWSILVCGGGRKNQTLIKKIKETIPNSFEIKSIDECEIDGDFVESQAFAYLAIRSFLNLPISFPSTTGCKEPVTGGELIKNF